VQALDGVKVGSQVIAVIPPDLGYGDVDQGSIPAGSTLIFVIDVLGKD
jgi:peptidylprolyl isomerase